MQIHHLINGAAVAGAQYFDTVNPATQEVLAQVARGGEQEVDAAVAAAKAAFPRWAAKPATERARLLRKLGDLISLHVPDLARTETQDTGQVIAQTAKQLVPRSADNFHYFAEMCVRVDGRNDERHEHGCRDDRSLRHRPPEKSSLPQARKRRTRQLCHGK